MAHPYFHALSSVRQWGGVISDYIDKHQWFDYTKSHVADARHRLILHHADAVGLFCAIHGEYFENSDGQQVSNRLLGQQHVIEDFGKLMQLKDVAVTLQSTHKVPEFNKERAHTYLIDRKNLNKQDAYKVESFFGIFADALPEVLAPAGQYMLTNAFGIFLFQDYIGQMFNYDNGRSQIPSRAIAEKYILAGYGKLPTLHEVITSFSVERWMFDNAVALAQQFKSHVIADMQYNELKSKEN